MRRFRRVPIIFFYFSTERGVVGNVLRSRFLMGVRDGMRCLDFVGEHEARPGRTNGLTVWLILIEKNQKLDYEKLEINEIANSQIGNGR